MCGLTGILHPNHNDIIIDMTEAIAHRGPDDFGYFSSENISLGHRRLSIQDLSSNGHQPMSTEDNRYCIVFNGEIYNHFEIREGLKDKYTFKSSSDTETILYGYSEYGVELFNKLNGIFAIAIYDSFTKDLIIVRDQFGVKPLYYYHKGDVFMFSSEIKSMLEFPGFDKELDSKGILQYIRFLWSPGERTAFKYVKKLHPCHYIKLNVAQPEKIDLVKYYTIPFTGEYDQKTEEEWIDALDNKLFEAVKRQLLSDVPIGFFLSGGLDSSAIVAMAKKAMPEKAIKCYTVDSGSKSQEDEGFADDLFYAKKVAKHLNVDLEIVVGKENIMDGFDKMVWHLDEPQADVAPLHVLNICTQARKDGFKVLLGGTGGDDVFSGYRRHQALYYEKYIQFIPSPIVSICQFILNKFHSANPKIRRVKKIFFDLNRSTTERLLGYFSWISLASSKKLLSENLFIKSAGFDSMEVLEDTFKYIPNEKSLLNKMLYLELKYFLPDHNLNYTDKLSMAVGVEVRVPFLDKELVEFSTKIPPRLKMKGTTTKYLLKKVMERYLPYDVIYRPKAGFGAPVRTWIKSQLKEQIRTTFNKENIEKEDIFNFINVQKLLKNNDENKYDASYSILSLMAIKSWYNQFGR